MTHYWKQTLGIKCDCKSYALINGVEMECDLYSDDKDDFKDIKGLIYLGEGKHSRSEFVLGVYLEENKILSFFS